MELAFPLLIPAEEMERLYRHDWPGNVRALRNVVERAVIRGKKGTTCLPLRFELEARQKMQIPTTEQRAATGNAMENAMENAGGSARGSAGPSMGAKAPVPGPLPSLEAMGDRYVAWMLEYSGGKISGADGAAARLGVHPNTVRERARRGRLA